MKASPVKLKHCARIAATCIITLAAGCVADSQPGDAPRLGPKSTIDALRVQHLSRLEPDVVLGDRLLGESRCGLGGSCQELNVGDTLVSPNGRATLVMQSDGNLVLYRNDAAPGISPALWSTKTWAQPCTVAVMQWDGNFVLYDSSGKACWSTGTWDHPGAYVVLQDSGNLVVYDNGVPLWDSNTALPPDPDHLLSESTCAFNGSCQGFSVGGGLTSSNGRVSLILQSDGNLLLRRNDAFNAPVLWSTNLGWIPVCDYAIMQWDGNFVLLDGHEGDECWSTRTSGHPGAYIVLQDDGNLVVYDGGVALWASNTELPPPDDRLLGNAGCGRGGPCQKLNLGGGLTSPNGRISLILGSGLSPNPGDLVLVKNDVAPGTPPLWFAHTWPCSVAVMQWDGNFVLYEPGGKACWSTGTWGHPGAYIVVQNDGNLVVYDNGSALWATNTILP
jgi:hypothetical protein